MIHGVLNTAWIPYPFRQFVLKVHGLCNLACDYCYVYEAVDQRWRTRPAVMSRSTMNAVSRRIAEHVRSHRMTTVHVVLHGGEPLLAGKNRIEYCVEQIRAAVGNQARVAITVQTNGVRLDESWLAVFRRRGVRVGVSLDGDQGATDRHRRRRDGSSSHIRVLAGIARLARPENREIYAGLLCAIDVKNNPVDTYEALLQHSPPTIDFLLPHGNWTNLPPARDQDASTTPYADWLIAVFDRWYEAPEKETRVRYFDEMVNVLLGGTSTLDGIGLAPSRSIVVETDGSIESSDSLTATFEGAGTTGLSVEDNTFDAAMIFPDVVERQLGIQSLAPECRQCPLVRTCGGGLHPHRYRAGSGFRNPSVYCVDLTKLILHVRQRLQSDTARLGPPAR